MNTATSLPSHELFVLSQDVVDQRKGTERSLRTWRKGMLVRLSQGESLSEGVAGPWSVRAVNDRHVVCESERLWTSVRSSLAQADVGSPGVRRQVLGHRLTEAGLADCSGLLCGLVEGGALTWEIVDSVVTALVEGADDSWGDDEIAHAVAAVLRKRSD